jgi:hypothetical protein
MVSGASGHIANMMALQQHPIYSKWGACNPLLSSRGGEVDTHKKTRNELQRIKLTRRLLKLTGEHGSGAATEPRRSSL